MKKCSKSLAIREIQIKTTLRYHLQQFRMAKIDKAVNNKCWRGCGERGSLLHCWWECKLVQPLWKTVWWSLKKLKTEIPYDPAIALLAIYPQRYRCSEKKGRMHPNVHSSNVHNSQTMEGAKMPFNRWMDKEDVVQIYNGILLGHLKGWVSTICIDMDGTEGDYAKWNESNRERQLSYGFTLLWNIRTRMIGKRRKG